MTMRRFGARWRDATTPREILDIFFVEGRYEVLIRNSAIDGSEEWADGLDIDGAGDRYASFELLPHQAAAYRYHNGKRRRAWVSIPKRVRETVITWLDQ